jgi:uncharacterized protein YukE
MAHGGFRTAPADLAAAAPRLSVAAEGLSAALCETEAALADFGPFWGADGEFEHEYSGGRDAAAGLAAECARALRALARQSADAAASYTAAEDAATGAFTAVGRAPWPESAGERP